MMASDLSRSDAIKSAYLHTADEHLSHAAIQRHAYSVPIYGITYQDAAVEDLDLDTLAGVTPLDPAPCWLAC
jgi:hypothetical protein